MNYHYIDYMLKERRRWELEECKRIQLLKAAGYGNTSPANRLFSWFKKTAIICRLWLTNYVRQPGRIFLTVCISAGPLVNEGQAKRGQNLFSKLPKRPNNKSK